MARRARRECSERLEPRRAGESWNTAGPLVDAAGLSRVANERRSGAETLSTISKSRVMTRSADIHIDMYVYIYVRMCVTPLLLWVNPRTNNNPKVRGPPYKGALHRYVEVYTAGPLVDAAGLSRVTNERHHGP